MTQRYQHSNNQDYNDKSLNATVSRIETKLDHFTIRHEDHERRIVKVERSLILATGIFMACIFILKYLVK